MKSIHSTLESNCKPKLTRRASAIIGMCTFLLPLTSVLAADPPECVPGAGGGLSQQIVVQPSVAHVGDTITINTLRTLLAPQSCTVSNGVSYIMYPNGNTAVILAGGNGLNGVQMWQNHYNLPNSPDQLQCMPAPVGDAGCRAITTTYTVLAADINRTLGPFTTPNPRPDGSGVPGGFATIFQPGQANRIQFMTATEAFKNMDGQGEGVSAPAPVQIVFPGLTVTKECVQMCPVPPGGTSRFGQPINIRSIVCNTSAVIITNITVVNTPEGGSPTLIATIGILNPGQCATNNFSYMPAGNPCGPFRDTLVATGTDFQPPGVIGFQPRTVSATNSATCTVCTAPCIEVIKTCLDTNVPAGTPIRYEFRVRNCGDVPLQNVVAVDDSATPGITADDVTTQVGSLAIGETKGPFQGTFQTSIDDCRVDRISFTNTVRATGANICNPAQTVSDSDSCVARIQCRPCIRITEEVVCVKPDTLCDAFTPNPNDQTNACGMRNESSTDCSAFCFKIVIEAVCIDGTPSPVPVSNIRVTSKLDLSNCNFPTTLPRGGMAMCIIPAVTLCTNFTDIVTVTATGPDNTPVPPDADDTDSVSVVIRPIAVRCVSTFTSPADTDGNPNDNCVRLPSTQNTTPVTLTTTIFNDSDVDLVVTVNNLPPLVNCNDRVTPIVITQPIAIAARGTHVITGCYLAACADITFNINVKGTVNTNSPNADCRCFYNRDGRPIMTDVNANDNCPVCVQCMLRPDIEVVKEVACLLPGDTCGPFAKSATGVRDSACPAFCYRISVTNVGPVPIVTLTVTDPVLGGILSAQFGPLPIAPGDSRTAIIKPIVHCVDTPDTVRAEGRSADGQTDVDQDSAEVHVLSINILCSISLFATNDLDGNPNDAHLLVPGSESVQFTLTLMNSGNTALKVVSLNGLPPLIDCTTGLPVVPTLPITIAPGGSAVVSACTAVTCPAGAQYSVTARAEADDQNGTLCVYDRNGTRITDETTCTAAVECAAKAGCTPGFWKNCTIHWQLTGYRTGQSISSVFTLGGCCGTLGSKSLKSALDFGGGSTVCGGAQNLLRAGVAALLNASSPEVDYTFTTSEVIGMVNAALQSCDRATMINVASELDRLNNQGCVDANRNELPCLRLTQ